MKHFKNLFVVPYSASDEGGESGAADSNTGQSDASTLEALLNQMDAGTDNSSEDNANAQQQDNQANSSGEPQQQQQQQPTQQERQNYAFGQMRTQITELTNLLGRVAAANGIEYSDNKDLIAKLTDDTIARMAQRQNVPVELLREIEALRQDSQAFKQQQLRDAAAIGFQKLVDTYGLSQQQLEQFAVELDQKGKNPFTQPLDILAEYKMAHYDDILKAEVQKAVQEALTKSSAADQNSSTPGQHQGGNGGGDNKITTVAGLSALLDGVK